ncbi:hypothetical protein BDV96DRAFT_204849 [Lophiotrema nucula]|uniref:Uncharacterized protein n=1 Tax=Lophiotrema nucula TaxID=690887 RepID=A0A6A5ZNY1_9PLEO|nr:hypothetical protein BDV96DRAFT_204849 [Lophiotrema nucula]
MATQKSYSVEELHHLRQSPLVQKPDGLPSIEQWMDPPADANAGNTSSRRPRSGVLREVEGAAAENRTDRPLLINAGMGHFGRRASHQAEDTILGPPKLSFTSASRQAVKAAEQAGKRLPNVEDDQLGDRFPTRGERWKRDRDDTRDRTNGRRTREDGEGGGWTNVKPRKSLGQEDFDRGFGRNGDRHGKEDAEPAEGGARRTNTARDKLERWGRREDNTTKEGEANNRFSGGGGWRDRERDREKERDWTRGGGGNRAEVDPEWMDTKADAPERKQAKTQEDFQKWKEQMKAKDAPVEERKEPQPERTEPHHPTEHQLPSFFSTEPSVAKVTTPLTGDISQGIFFGNWGKETKASEPTGTDTAKAKPKAEVGRKSKFANMFATKAEETPVPVQSTVPASPGLETTIGEDQQGFNRILQMLQNTRVGPSNGASQGGVSLDLFQQSRPEEPTEAPQRQQRRTVEQQQMIDNILAPRPSAPESRSSQPPRLNTISPESSLLEQFGLPRTEVNRPESNRPGDDFIQGPPSRNSGPVGPQDAHLHALLNNRSRPEANRDPENKNYLLQLMQGSNRGTPPQLLGQNMPRQPPENQNLPPFFDQPGGPQRIQGQPKNRGLPPGFDDPRLFAEHEMMRRDAEQREIRLREANMRELNMQQQEAMRKNPRLPIGNFPEDPAAMLQRRNTAGEISRQMTNMGIPSQPIPDLPYMRGNPGMPPTPGERNIPPPPGFSNPGGMRNPPGFGHQGGPQNIGPPFSAGNTPMGHPPGIPPPRGMGGMFQGGPGQNNMPPAVPPHGYPFPPYGPPMGMRGGEDPRMMMGRPEFEQFGGPAGPGPRQPGRPPNMY